MIELGKASDTESRAAKAPARHDAKYNCSQSVLCTYADLLGISKEEAYITASALGSGMTAFSTCGAVTAMALAAGFATCDGKLDQSETKKTTTMLTRAMIAEFLEKNGSLLCRELKGIDTGTVMSSCDKCIEDASLIIEKHILGITSGKPTVEK